ncbi:unnamed protein product [Gordionus sp. m RMFG-2023]|uniref:terminal nucleotidyltransferase 4B-like n=1 Tax=Gordionus sp. m RMFG-2023 TaxID=3053472 RepID=UPI0030DDE201
MSLPKYKSLSNGNNYQKPKYKDKYNSPNTSYNSHKIQKYSQTLPWMQLRNIYSQEPIIRLHEEILDAYTYLKPSTIEYTMRVDLVNRIKTMINDVWPNALVEVFGSFKTGLYLPTSDVDIVLIGKWEALPLWTLKEIILKCDFSYTKDIQVLNNAAVPIVKFTDKKTRLNVDISFNMVNGIASCHLINEFTEKYPILRPLIVVLKQFLIQRQLKEVFTGGLSSYSLILMILNFIQNNQRLQQDLAREDVSQINLGVLLIEFFEMFGRHFNYHGAGIRVNISNLDNADYSTSIRQSYYYFPKQEFAIYKSSAGRTSLLCIQDPLIEEHDTAKSSYAFAKVHRAFLMAYVILSRSLLPTFYARDARQSCDSILGQIIQIPEEMKSYRRWVNNNYKSDHDI